MTALDTHVTCLFADLQALRTEDQSKFTEQLADMEHKLNEARREHAKAGRNNEHKQHGMSFFPHLPSCRDCQNVRLC